MDNAAREKWALTQEAFDGFLTALATDSDGAADRYLDIPATWYAFSSGATAPPRMIMRMKPSIDAPERLWKPAPTLAHPLSRFYLARAVQLWISRHLYLDRCIGSKLTGQTDRSVAPLSITISSCIHKDSDGSYQTVMSGQLSDQCSRDLRRRRCHDDSIKGASSGQPL